MSEMLFTAAIARTLEEEMLRDERVFCMGEDIAKLGGIFGATRGLLDKFGPERVRDTPISETAILGAALGAACSGLRPVVDMQYMDFIMVAFDQLVDQIAKTRYMFGSHCKVPLVIRAQQGVGTGNAANHSQCYESVVAHFPGLKIVMPSSAEEEIGLLRTAIRDDNPVVIFESKKLYKYPKWTVPDDPEFMIPFGKANIVRPGRDITLVTASTCVHRAMEAAAELEQQGISVEVIDLRTLVPLDEETVFESVKKTGRLLVVHEDFEFCGWGAEIVARVVQNVFMWLDAAPMRVGSLGVPIPFSPGLEQAVIPSPNKIIAACRQLMPR
ncbi:MAG: alpha-ketoacid dehydrogenase subunit beta [Oscillibacter sp.]|nr:alpha-ketoacid dehydrogenase subunit beta [Oscillibacter sp.]